jgi:excisionase family DNA binding protein
MDITEAAQRGWLSPAQAARILEVSVERVRQMVSEGKLLAEKTVLGRLIDPDSVAALAEKRADHAPR